MSDFVVIGLGYVGLPLVQAACRAGLRGVGLDVNAAIVGDLNAGLSHVDDLSEADLRDLLDSGFTATTDPRVIGDADVVVISVPTPLGAEGGPDLGAVRAATQSVRDHLRSGVLVVLESTTWPGTTAEVVRPILEQSGLRAGVDFNLAYSPERIDPGNLVYNITNTPKVVGGFTERCGDVAAGFYGKFIDVVIRAGGTREAEAAKLLENTYRQVNIALVNEMAKFSYDLGIDIWNVIECASSKPFGFQRFTPGPGVGGHCIPIDPSYLSHKVRAELGYPFRFVELAQEVNRSMPKYVIQRAQEMLNDARKAVRGSVVLVLGVTYKPGISDQRESPALPIGNGLREFGANLRFYDPFVESWHLDGVDLLRESDLARAVSESDLVIHLQPHPSYGSDMFRDCPVPVLDARGVLVGAAVRRL